MEEAAKRDHREIGKVHFSIFILFVFLMTLQIIIFLLKKTFSAHANNNITVYLNLYLNL